MLLLVGEQLSGSDIISCCYKKNPKQTKQKNPCEIIITEKRFWKNQSLIYFQFIHFIHLIALLVLSFSLTSLN